MSNVSSTNSLSSTRQAWFAFPAAAALCAFGVVVAPGAAQAAACSQFGFPNGANGFDTGWGASLPFTAAGKSVGPTATGWLGGIKGAGYFSGNVNGTGLSFTWKGDGGPPNFSGGDTVTFTGTVDNDGSAHGTAMNTTTNAITTFTSQKRLACLDAPAAAAKQDPPKAADQPAVQPAVRSVTILQQSNVYDSKGGNRIGGDGFFLEVGSTFDTAQPCADNWCLLKIPGLPGGPHGQLGAGYGWVYSGIDTDENFVKVN
jgi:hypothetical protein